MLVVYCYAEFKASHARSVVFWVRHVTLPLTAEFEQVLATCVHAGHHDGDLLMMAMMLSNSTTAFPMVW